jgi:magnesium-transporting ATPase (P-type)
MRITKKKAWLKRSVWIGLGAGLLITAALWIRRLLMLRRSGTTEPGRIFKYTETGLSHAEAQLRKSDNRTQARLSAEKHAQREQLKRRVLSIFNLTMLVLAVTQLFLQDIWGALGTLGALILNIAIGTFQQARSAKQVGKLLSIARPKATVLREGELSNIDQDDIVIGDLLVAGNGDGIFADGTVLESAKFHVDTSPYDHEPTIEEKFAGDRLTAGSFCESGWGIYRVEHIPVEGEEDQISLAPAPISEAGTPLQKSIQTMLLILLAIAGIFYVILIIELFRLEYFPSELITIYRQAITIIFSIAPSGLLFMVIINYAVGSANIAKSGALIRSNHTIEELARISSLLMIRKRNLDSLSLEIEMIPDATGEFTFSETRTRQLLGNYVHSLPSMRFPFSIIKDELDGNRYPLNREARFFSVLGWEAINFDSEDMLGTYIIGYPEFLLPYLEDPLILQTDEPEPIDSNEGRIGLKGKITNLWSRVRLKKEQPDSPDITENTETSEQADFSIPEQQNRWQKLLGRFKSRKNNPEISEAAPEIESSAVIRLLFAYAPGTFHLSSSIPQPPADLAPVCFLNIVKAYRPDVRAAFQAIQDAGISQKILSSGQLHDIDGLAKELGIEDKDALASQIISGDELIEQLSSRDTASIHEKTVFYQHTSEQMKQVIELLHNEGQYVALHNRSNAKIPLMSHADVNITTHGSSIKLLSKSDVILMDNSPTTLPTIFLMGKNIVHSVVNLLKINLVEIGYVLLLLVAMFLTGNRQFVYEPVHGGIIGIFTITLPSFFISLWTNSLKADRQNIRRQLRMFIIPAIVTITLVVMATFFLFDWRGYPLYRIQHTITHLLIMIGLLLVVFCYPPIPMLSGDGKYVSDWRLTKVALALFIILHALTFLPLFQRYLRLYPLVSFIDYVLIWVIGLGWGLMTLLLWRLGWRSLDRRP